jgi:hypothetical protein
VSGVYYAPYWQHGPNQWIVRRYLWMARELSEALGTEVTIVVNDIPITIGPDGGQVG